MEPLRSRPKVVLSQGGVEKFNETTDVSGKYKVDSAPAGEYDVAASLAPHAATNAKANVTSEGGVCTVDLQLG